MKDKIPDDVIKEIFPKRLKRRDVNGEVYNKLKKMILSGKLKRGQRLIEEKLAYDFNVSRQPVRSAFLQLRKDKLIVWKYKKGTFVSFEV
jgi:GntR family transcriptional regulator, rspAB operon transcriptional repressor